MVHAKELLSDDRLEKTKATIANVTPACAFSSFFSSHRTEELLAAE